jgi:hypothetical protein
VRVVRVNLLLGVALGALAMASPAHAAPAPVAAHAMVHTCCTPDAEKERIFSEAKALGARYIRVDVELNGIFAGPDAEPDWSGLDKIMELSQKYDLRVLGILLVPLHYTDSTEFAERSGQVAEHAAGAIDHWEVLNEPDGDWAWAGTAEDYARMLSGAHDAIKAVAPNDAIVLGGLQKPHEPGWLGRVFDTPGADAIHKFDIANIHMRGSVDAVLRRYDAFRSWLRERGFTGPLWVTEHGSSADPAYQSDPAYRAGEASQAAYLTQSLVGLGEAGAPQVFVTLHDGGLEGEYAAEGLEHIDETPGGDYPVTRRPAFAAMRRLVDDWDQITTWRAEQRDQEQQQRVDQAKAALWTDDARAAREKFRVARESLHAAQRSNVVRRVERARALLAGSRTAFLLKGAIAHWHAQRAADHASAVAWLEQQIAGG